MTDSEKLKIAVEVLHKIGAYFDCMSCEMSEVTCEDHLHDRMQWAKEALSKISQPKERGEERRGKEVLLIDSDDNSGWKVKQIDASERAFIEVFGRPSEVNSFLYREVIE